MPAKIDLEEEPSGAGSTPIASEADPGIGRRAGYIQMERAASGGLPDSPGDLDEKAPFRQTGQRR
jgi:hypothetical protein